MSTMKGRSYSTWISHSSQGALHGSNILLRTYMAASAWGRNALAWCTSTATVKWSFNDTAISCTKMYYTRELWEDTSNLKRQDYSEFIQTASSIDSRWWCACTLRYPQCVPGRPFSELGTKAKSSLIITSAHTYTGCNKSWLSMYKV